MFVITPDASGRTEEDRFALLAEEFPEASEAIERGASPWEVENSEISVKILARYDEMRAEDGKMVVVPLIEAIADLGFESTIGWDSVRVVSILTKDAILKIVTRPEVIHAEEMGGLEQPTDNSAIRIFLPTMIR